MRHTSRLTAAGARRSLSALLVLVLLAAAALHAQAPADRSRPPLVGPAPPLSLPEIHKRQLSNGLPVWMVELHEVPVVQVNLVVLGGSGGDPAGQFGIASFMAAMLTNGAGARTALEIADAIDFLGAGLTAAAGMDSTGVRLNVPVARLGEALPIMADVALRPTFPIDEIDRLRQQRLTSLLQARDDPSTIAAATFSRVLYGAVHRYGAPAMGTAQTIRAFTRENLRSFYTATFRPENAALVVVGDVVPARVMGVLESTFGAWKPQSGPVSQPVFPPVPPRTRREVYIVDKPGAAQSQIRIGSIGVARSTPDFFPLQVANTVLGGSFSSRLNMNLREKHGYTYGASSSFDMRTEPGPFTAGAGVQTDKTSEALKEFFNELDGILRTVPADELARTKSYLSLRFPGGFETTGDISRRLEEAIVYRLSDDYLSGYVRNIDRIDSAEVRRVAETYIRPDRAAVVVVGDRKVIESGIRALNLGPLSLLTLDEVFGPRN